MKKITNYMFEIKTCCMFNEDDLRKAIKKCSDEEKDCLEFEQCESFHEFAEEIFYELTQKELSYLEEPDQIEFKLLLEEYDYLMPQHIIDFMDNEECQ